MRVLFSRLSKLPAWLPPVAVIPPEQGRFDPLDGPRFHERQREMGVALIAPTISRLYESAGFLTFGLFADLETVGSLSTRDVVVQGRTESALLEGWIHTLLSMSLQENCLFSRFQVEAVEPRRIRGTVSGERIDPTRHRLHRPLGSVRLRDAHLTLTQDECRAQLAFEIREPLDEHRR